MSKLICKHCGGNVETDEEICTHCGMPLPPDSSKDSQRKFILVIIALTIICIIMILWLPRELMQYPGR